MIRGVMLVAFVVALNLVGIPLDPDEVEIRHGVTRSAGLPAASDPPATQPPTATPTPVPTVGGDGVPSDRGSLPWPAAVLLLSAVLSVGLLVGKIRAVRG